MSPPENANGGTSAAAPSDPAPPAKPSAKGKKKDDKKDDDLVSARPRPLPPLRLSPSAEIGDHLASI
jgi:hypothetical protein